MKIIREDTERTYGYLASIYPFADATTPDDEIGWQMVLTVHKNLETNKPGVRGLGQFSYTREMAEQLRDALDEAINEMKYIEQMVSEGK